MEWNGMECLGKRRRVFPEKPVLFLEKPVLEKPVLEKPVLEKPVLEKPVLEKPVLEKPVLEKPVLFLEKNLKIFSLYSM
jgi:hypothetical protein